MRMITQDLAHHNVAHVLSQGMFRLLPILLLLAVTACSQDQDSESQQTTGEDHQAAACDVTMDTSAWTDFKELADRIHAGEKVPREDLDAYGEQPAVTVWRQSMEPNVPPALRVGNWLEGLFWEDLGRQGKQKPSASKTIYMTSYRYSLENRDRIDERLAELTGPMKCDLAELTGFWIDPGKLPKNLTLRFLPGESEIRIFENSLLVDTGVVAAGSPLQIIRHMAALLYRNFQYVLGDSPLDKEGAEAVAHMFRVVMNEGYASWVEQTPFIEFDRQHPRLWKFTPIPEEYFSKTQAAVALLNHQLAPMLEDEAMMIEKAQPLAKHLGAMNAYAQTGYGMAAVIAGHLGEDRLRQVNGSVHGFLAAYQEAAAMNPVPAPEPGDPGVELFQTVPPLETEVFTGLQALLIEVFGE